MARENLSPDPQQANQSSKDDSQGIIGRRMDRRRFLTGVGRLVVGLGATAVLSAMPDRAKAAAAGDEPGQVADAAMATYGDIPQATTGIGEARQLQEVQPLDHVLANVRVDTAVRAQNPLKDLVFGKTITAPDGEFQAGFVITTGTVNNEVRHGIYGSWMQGGQRTEYEPLTNTNIPIGIIKEAAFFPSGNTFIAGDKNGPCLLYAPNNGRDVNGRDKQWTSVTVKNNSPSGEGEVSSIKEVVSANPHVAMNQDIAVYAVYARVGYKAEVQIIRANGNTVEEPIRTGLEYSRVKEVLSAKTVDGNIIEMLFNTDEGLAAAKYDMQEKKILSHAIIHKGGDYKGHDSYEDVNGQQADIVVDRLNKQLLSIQGGIVAENPFQTWINHRPDLPGFLSGTFYLQSGSISITDKGSKELIAIGSRNISGQEKPVPVAVKIHPFIPGVNPDPKDITVYDISQVIGGVTNAKRVKMMGHVVTEFDQRGVAHSTFSHERGTVTVTDRGIGRTQQPGTEPTPSPSPTPTQTGNITYTQKMTLPVVARNGSPQTAQSTTTRR